MEILPSSEMFDFSLDVKSLRVKLLETVLLLE
jgi:hypothetical protein